MPRRSATPGRKPSTRTSALSTSSITMATAFACLRSSPIDRRPRAKTSNLRSSGRPRSKGSIRSTRKMLAPRSASIMQQNGPGPMPASSSTFIPDSGPLMAATATTSMWLCTRRLQQGFVDGGMDLVRLASGSACRFDAEPAGKILHVLPRHAARARAARRRPFQRLAPQVGSVDRHAVMGDIAFDHGEIFVLAAAVKAEPQPKAVGQRHFLLDRLAGIDPGRALVLHHVTRHEVAAVRGGVEDDILRPALDAAFEHGLQRFVGGV